MSRTPPQHEACLWRLNIQWHDRSRSTQWGLVGTKRAQSPHGQASLPPTSSSSGREPPDPSLAQLGGRAVPQQLCGPPAGWAGPGMPGGPGASGRCWLLRALRQAGVFPKGSSASAAPPPVPAPGSLGRSCRQVAAGSRHPLPLCHPPCPNPAPLRLSHVKVPPKAGDSYTRLKSFLKLSWGKEITKRGSTLPPATPQWLGCAYLPFSLEGRFPRVTSSSLVQATVRNCRTAKSLAC